MKKFLVAAALLVALAGRAQAADVTFEWDYISNPAAPAVSFRLYWWLDCSGADDHFADTTELTVAATNLTPGAQYCASAKAVAADGRMSEWSNTVFFTVPAAEPGVVNVPMNLRIP